MKTGMSKVIYDRVFVLAGEMEKTNGGHKFLEEDKSGFLHGEIRFDAIKILYEQSRIKKEIIFVGGPVKNDRANYKPKIMKELMEKEAKVNADFLKTLESDSNTESNILFIKDYLNQINNKHKNEKNGLLTHFYHLPRVLRLIIREKKLRLLPICAEAVLLQYDPSYKEKIEKWYDQKSMITRVYWEIHGLTDIGKGKY